MPQTVLSQVACSFLQICILCTCPPVQSVSVCPSHPFSQSHQSLPVLLPCPPALSLMGTTWLSSACPLQPWLSRLLLENLQKLIFRTSNTLSKPVLNQPVFPKVFKVQKAQLHNPHFFGKTSLKSRNIIRTFPFEGKRSKSLHRF